MNLLSFFEIDAVPRVRVETYPVSVTAATGGDRYKEIAQLSIPLPELPLMPEYLKGWSGVAHLFELHRQAAKWTPMTADQRKKAEWVWKNALQKDKDSYLDAVTALHELREQGKQLSPLLWCWWRITKQIEEGYTGLAFSNIWSARIIRSTKMRRWFYEEVNQEFITRRVIWPKEAEELLLVVRDFESECAKIPSQATHAEVWKRLSARYDALMSSAQFSRDAAITRINDRVAKFDLGIWLSFDPIEYLGLSGVKSNLIQTPSAGKPVLRKRRS